MFKRTVTLVALLFAIVAPAALADSGNPPTTAAPSTPAANVSRGDFNQRLDALHDRIKKAVDRFVDHCAKQKGDRTRCKAAAEKGLDRLQKISDRIDDRVAKIKERCGGGTSTQPVPKACGHADEVVAKLRTVQSEVKELAGKIRAWLADPAAGSTGSSGTTSSSDGSGLQSLDGLAADLAAAQAAAGN